MVVLINLDSADVRRRHMMLQLAGRGVTFQRVGIDLRTCNRAAVEACARNIAPTLRFDHDRLSSAEVGCWLSHVMAWQRLFGNADRHAGTVIEDDVVLGADFSDAVSALEGDARFEVVMLGTSSRNVSTRRNVAIDRFRAHVPIGAIFNTWGYVIQRSYVERLLAVPSLWVNVPIDHVLGGRWRTLQPTLGVVQPAVVTEHAELGQRSQIEPHTTRIDRWRIVGEARRRLLSSRLSSIYYSIYRLL